MCWSKGDFLLHEYDPAKTPTRFKTDKTTAAELTTTARLDLPHRAEDCGDKQTRFQTPRLQRK